MDRAITPAWAQEPRPPLQLKLVPGVVPSTAISQKTSASHMAAAGLAARARGRWPGTLPIPLPRQGANVQEGTDPAFPSPLLPARAGLEAATTRCSGVPWSLDATQGGVGDSRDEDLLHVVDDLLAHHDDQELLCQLDEAATGRALRQQGSG